MLFFIRLKLTNYKYFLKLLLLITSF